MVLLLCVCASLFLKIKNYGIKSNSYIILSYFPFLCPDTLIFTLLPLLYCQSTTLNSFETQLTSLISKLDTTEDDAGENKLCKSYWQQPFPPLADTFSKKKIILKIKSEKIIYIHLHICSYEAAHGL